MVQSTGEGGLGGGGGSALLGKPRPRNAVDLGGGSWVQKKKNGTRFCTKLTEKKELKAKHY